MSTDALVGRSHDGHHLTSFIGRRRELTEARELMSRSRLLTLAGPGGVGKTRLALELVSRVRKAFSDGVFIVELAEVEDGAMVGPHIAAALRLPDQSNRSSLQRIADYVQDRHLLLVLDNCEHLLDAVSVLAARLLDRAARLRIVATSREPLGIFGEQVYNVPPLAAPVHTAAEGMTIESFDAVRLLIDRARSVDPTFEVTEANRLAVAQLCQRLDGIPLAIELAATRLRSVSVVQLIERLDKRFDILTGGSRAALPRQQTLRALIDWSHELCSSDERLLWARLSVFPGGFEVEAAEEVCGFGQLTREGVLDLIDHLVAKSLVVAENVYGTQTGGSVRVRYRQLMTFREYGAELLESIGETTDMRRRQRDHYLTRAAATVKNWCGPHQAERLMAARRDHPNLVSALEWSASTPGEERAGLHLAALLRYHWTAGGNLAEGRRWLDRLLKLATEPSPERGAALWVGAWICLVQGDREQAREHVAECRLIAESLNDRALAAHADHWEALCEVFDDHLDRAMGLFTAAVGVHRQVGDTASALYALFLLAWTQMYAGRTGDALATCREVLKVSDSYGERWAHAYADAVMGLCQWHVGELDAARQSQIAALEIQRDFPDGLCIALTIEQMSWTAASGGHYESAAVLYHAARAVWSGIGTTISAFGPLEKDFEQMATKVRRELGEREFKVLTARPEPSQEQAIELALGAARTGYASTGTPQPGLTKVSTKRRNGTAETPDGYGKHGGTALTQREAQIAGLVSQGLSNKEIAAQLVVSPRTVGGHIERILAKLGFNSRTQIASLMSGPAGAGLVGRKNSSSHGQT